MISRRRLIASTAFAALAAPHVRPAAAQQTITLRIAHVLSQAEPAHDACEWMARNVAQRTNNRVQIQVFGAGQLGGNREIFELVRQGANVMSLVDPSGVSDFIPDWGVLNGPYLLSNPFDYRKILRSDWYRELIERSAQQRMRVVTMNGFFGPRHSLGTKPLRNPDDMRGVAFRVPPTQMWLETFRALGTRPVTVPWPEVYNALSQNVVEAVEAPLASLWGSRLHETRRVISLTNHFNAWIGLVMNEQVYRRLPADVQTMLVEEGAKMGDHLTQLTIAANDDLIRRFEAAGIQIVRDIDIPAMTRATERVYSAIPGWSPGLYDRVRAILAAA